MCESTGHAGCELAALALDYPSWVIVVRHLPKVLTEGGGYQAVDVAEASRGGLTLQATGEGRLGQLRQMLVRQEAGEG